MDDRRRLGQDEAEWQWLIEARLETAEGNKTRPNKATYLLLLGPADGAVHLPLDD